MPLDADTNLPADAPWWARWLVAEWRDFWKWSTAWLVAVAGTVPLAYETIPGLKDMIPAAYVHYANGVLAICTFINLLRRKPAGSADEAQSAGATPQGAKP